MTSEGATNHAFQIPGGKSVSGPELGGRVISTLLSRYREQTGSDQTTAAIITVPAKFPDYGVEATRECGMRAGLKYCELLAEPRAAALAYGFDNKKDRAQWLVFDLGAGTLDISVVAANNGGIEVMSGSDGDNFLGGTKWDSVLLQYLLGPRKKEADRDQIIEDYRRINKHYDGGLRNRIPELNELTLGTDIRRWNQLLLIIEQARIDLSTAERVQIDFDRALADTVKSSQLTVRFRKAVLSNSRSNAAVTEKLLSLLTFLSSELIIPQLSFQMHLTLI